MRPPHTIMGWPRHRPRRWYPWLSEAAHDPRPGFFFRATLARYVRMPGRGYRPPFLLVP